MSQPPSPLSGKNSPSVPPVRRLQSPAERFGTPDTEPAGAAPESPEAAEVALDDPFRELPPLPRIAPRPAPRRRVTRRAGTPMPRPHQKRVHHVTHLPVNPTTPAPPAEATRNTMTRELVARKKRRTRRIVTRFLGIAAVIFVVQCGVAALTAPQFQVKNVEVTGLNETPAAQVKALTDTLVDRNVFRAPRAAVAQKVAALPTVESARIMRPLVWPPQLKLEVTERKPLVRVGSGDNWWVADAKGVPYRRAHQGDETLYALTAPQFSPQTGKALPAPEWKHARELVAALQADNALATPNQSGEKFWQLRRLYLNRAGFAAVRVSGAGKLGAHRELLVRLGEEDWAKKLAQARVAFQYLERTGQRAREIDLVSGKHPRWRPLAKIADARDLDEAESQS